MTDQEEHDESYWEDVPPLTSEQIEQVRELHHIVDYLRSLGLVRIEPIEDDAISNLADATAFTDDDPTDDDK